MATWDIDKITKSFSDPIAMIEAMNAGTLQDQIRTGPQRQQTDSFNGFVNGQYGAPTDDMSAFDIILASTNNPDMAANAAHDIAKFKESDLVKAYNDIHQSAGQIDLAMRLKSTDALASAAAQSVMERYPEMNLGEDSPMLAPPELAEYGEAFHLKDFEQNILSTTAESFGVTPGEIDAKIREIQKQGGLTDKEIDQVVSGGGTPKIDAWKDWYGEGWEDPSLDKIRKLWFAGKGHDNNDNAQNALLLGAGLLKSVVEHIFNSWNAERYGTEYLGSAVGEGGHSSSVWGFARQSELGPDAALDDAYETSAWNRYFQSGQPAVYQYDLKDQYLYAAAERLGAQADTPGIRAKIEADWPVFLGNYTLREVMKTNEAGEHTWNPIEGSGLMVYDYTSLGFTQKPEEFYSPESDKQMTEAWREIVRASGPGWGQIHLQESSGLDEPLTYAQEVASSPKLAEATARAMLKRHTPGGLRGRHQERGLQAVMDDHYQKQSLLPVEEQVGVLHTLSQMKGSPWYVSTHTPSGYGQA